MLNTTQLQMNLIKNYVLLWNMQRKKWQPTVALSAIDTTQNIRGQYGNIIQT